MPTGLAVNWPKTFDPKRRRHVTKSPPSLMDLRHAARIPWAEALMRVAREADRTAASAPLSVRRAVRARAIADKALRMKLSTSAATAVASVL